MIKSGMRSSLLSDPKFSVEFYRKKGVKIGDNVELYNVALDGRRPFLISIGNNCILTNCRVLTHDASTFLSTKHTKIGSVSIGNNVFVGAGAIILPGVRIGNNVIVGAGAVIAKDISSGSVVVGNPARIISDFNSFYNRNMSKILTSEIFYTGDEKDEIVKQNMIMALSEQCVYVKRKNDKG